MKKIAALAGLLLIGIALPAALAPPAADAERFWPQWRGPQMTGAAPVANPPVEWSETKNVRWKIEIPGKGSASPIVWGDRIFVLTAIPTGKRAERSEAAAVAEQQGRRGPRGIQPTEVHQFAVLAIRRSDGRVLWQRVVREELPHEGTHPTGTWASNSAVTDGEHVWAYFGSRGLYALDMNGSVKWEKDFGDMRIRLGFGEGSSPALGDDRLIINWDHEGESFIVALDKRTGQELWRTPREEMTSWTTPIIVRHGSSRQVITSATGKVRAYDYETGKLLWETTGMTLNTIPSPVSDGRMVFVTSGFRGNALLAIRLDAARGDISNSDAIAWRFDRDTPYVPSPLLYNGRLYILKSNSAIISCFNAKTGERLFGPERLEGMTDVYASPVGAAGRVYVFGRDGAGTVLADGAELKVLAHNSLDDGFDASPALVDSEIYLRGRRFLYRISEE